ncbi:MAG: hypothetical protein COB41_06525 [Proteobacteria bacterium]|nr:MAG: hypothetical protein COB41_06525 [Pseudomonadota bacterium]
MRRSTVSNRKQLIRPWSLSLIAIVVIGVLVLLMPKNSFLNNPKLIGKADALSVAYLQALLKADSENQEIRLLYAEHLAAIGNIDEASKQLKRMDINLLSVPTRAVILDLRMLVLKQLREPENKVLRKQLEQALKVAMSLPINTFSIDQWQRLGDLMLQAGQADLAANVYLHLAVQDKEHEANWLRESAKWFVASGQAHRASTVQLKLAMMTHSLKDSKDAVRYLLAAGEPMKMMQVVGGMIARFPEDRGLLKDAMQAASFTGQESEAILWGEAWLQEHSEDTEIMQLLIRLQLGVKKTKEAYLWAGKMSYMAPENAELHEQLANIAQWSGNTQEAYKQWKWLLEHKPSKKALMQTIFFANQLRDYPKSEALLLEAKSKYGTTDQTLKALFLLQEKLGIPEDAEQIREAYLRKAPNDQAAWHGLAILRAELGKLKAAEETWKEIEKRFGVSELSVTHRAQLLVSMRHTTEGLLLLQNYAKNHRVKSKAFWQVYGDLGWRLEYHDDAYKAYLRLWESEQAGSFEVQRLMILLREEGDIETTLEISMQAWQRFKDPNILLLAIESAIAVKRWTDVKKLMFFADSQMDYFRNSSRYWLAHAHWMEHENKLDLVENNFFKALHLNTESKEAKVGLLWVWMNAGKHKLLWRYLKRWKSKALEDKDYWRVYAAAYHSMGEHRAALLWFEKSMQTYAKDIPWLLEYADALAAAGQASGAWHLRQYLFKKLWAKSRLSNHYSKQNSVAMHEAQALLEKKLLGLPHAQAWVKKIIGHADDPVVREFAMRWYFGVGAESQASFWLMRQHAARLSVPVWQDLALAMGRNDLDSIYRILSRHASEVDHVSHMIAVRQQGLLNDAWELAMDTELGNRKFNAVERTTMLRYARDIAEQSPNAAHITLKMVSLGALSLNHLEAKVYRSRDNHTLSLQLGEVILKAEPSIGDLRGNHKEYYAKLASLHRTPRGDTLLYAGLNSRRNGGLDGGEFMQWGAGMHWRPWQGGEFGLLLDMGKVDSETSEFRMVGMKDVLTLSFNTDFTSREYLASSLKLNRYKTRKHEALARGYTFEATLGHRLGLANSLAEEQMQIRLSGQWMKNSLQPKLAGFAQGILTTTDVERVIPKQFSSLGLSFNIQKDILDNAPAIGRSPLYLLDSSVGWQWPASTPFYNLALGVGLPIVGRDLLSFRGFIANSGFSGDARYGLMLTYGSRFSR